jgi:transposase-like protein
MGMLSKLLGRKKTEPEVMSVECPHKALTPRWENAEDMGKQALVSSYTCSACGRSFSREEGAALLGV